MLNRNLNAVTNIKTSCLLLFIANGRTQEKETIYYCNLYVNKVCQDVLAHVWEILMELLEMTILQVGKACPKIRFESHFILGLRNIN